MGKRKVSATEQSSGADGVVEKVEKKADSRVEKKAAEKNVSEKQVGKRPKKLNMSNVSKMEKEKFPIKTIIVDVDGEEYQVGIHEKFKPTQIENVVKDMIWVQEECEKSGIEANIFTASLLALMKNFTDINFSKDDILQDINMFINMSNLGILDQIMSAFDPQEIEKLNKSITDMNKNMPKAMKMMEDLIHEQVDLQLEN